jgi:radical SAM superfamily enzyme YgiQ (UPF0313 family)
MSDILLINPPLYDTAQLGKLDCDAQFSPPLGIAYIAAILEQNNYEVKALDLYYVPMEEAKRRINKELGSIVGISCYSEQRVSTYRLIQYIRSLSKEVLIVIGGPHGTVLYQQLLEHFPIDVVALGEGERSFLELVQAHKKKLPLSNVPGLALKNDQGVYLTKNRALIKALDELPFPSYHHFVDTKYAPKDWFGNMKLGNRMAKDLKWTSIAASRGCVYDCSFCSTPYIWQGCWRKRSPANIVDEIEFLNKKFGYEFVDFADDIFTLNKNWSIAICKELIKRGNPVYWSCCTRVDAVSEELLMWMKRAGCAFVSYGIESFSAKILTAVNKKITKEKILTACDRSISAGVDIEFLLIVGSAGETDETIGETVELVKTVMPWALQPSIMTLFPGTKLYQSAVADNFICDEYWLTNQPCPYDTREHDIEVLKKWYHKMLSLN